MVVAPEGFDGSLGLLAAAAWQDKRCIFGDHDDLILSSFAPIAAIIGPWERISQWVVLIATTSPR